MQKDLATVFQTGTPAWLDIWAPVSLTSTPAATYTVGGTTAGTLRVSVPDIGQGDSILIQSPG